MPRNYSENAEGPSLALFDLDGTLISGDSMIEFIRFVKGSGSLYASYLMLAPMLFMYKAGLMKNEEAKKRLLAYHFRGINAAELEIKGKEFCEKILQGMFRKPALSRIAWHRKRGDTLCIVTSSLSWWVKPWCDVNGFNCISTLPQIEGGKFNGNFSTPNCYGAEKRRRILEIYKPSDFHSVWAYGDTGGDKEMLAMADHWYWKPFR